MASPLFGAKKPSIFPESTKPQGKVLFGNAKVRRRIEFADDELLRYVSPEYFRAAKQLILETNLDNLTLEEVLKWGSTEQEEHSKLIELLFAFSQNEALKKAKSIYLDLIEALKLHGEDSLLGKFFKKAGGVGEIKALAEKLKPHSNTLQLLRSEILILKDKKDKLIKSIEPLVGAASFFADYKKDNFPNDLFISRAQSLTSTQLTLRMNKDQIDGFEKTIVNLIDAINNILLTELPLWFTLIISDNLTANQKKQEIISKLEKYGI